ncbi:MAG: hypothetical protein Tsb004_03300 [Allomuricauda sp.]
MAYLGGIIENYMFECTDANQLEVHTKAKYSTTDSTLTFFIGKSKTEFFQKWNIPLRDVYIDINFIHSLTDTMKQINIKATEKDSVIQYSDNRNMTSKMTKSYNIYLFDWCDEKRQENFISALKRITELSKLK